MAVADAVDVADMLDRHVVTLLPLAYAGNG